MNDLQPFFFVGSRRSGTTITCHIINYHHKLYTPFERYIMWILLCIRENAPIRPPPQGALRPMLITFGQAGDAFEKFFTSDKSNEAARTAFFKAIDNCRMQRGTGEWRKEISAIGEKNPPEYATPATNKFILDVFPEAKFIHVVRHPTPVVRSQVRWSHLRPKDWIEERREQHYRDWLTVEKRVLQIKAPVLTIRYEDLVEEPVKESHRLYEFLGVDPDDHPKGPGYIDRRILNNVLPSGNTKYGDLAVPFNISGLSKMMGKYGYE